MVKDVWTSGIGGVLALGGELMEIAPLGDQLLIEARISPRDIAFIHPGQEANGKNTAYGSLPGRV
ncbi:MULTISPECIES: HlyD family efflux transporter periplasmic adaptor subunit [unclassified Pseudomonas]|uniref:HlyD family efflux transporter periplasmic adaptor subunit n=1 Tax=unclassified Pseudomonas TaxID=196821 RepID=UPI0034CDD1B1